MPIGGMIFLKGARKNSENVFKDLKGSLYHLTGSHVRWPKS